MSVALASTSRPSISVGSKVGSYRLIERLGEGGMGEVFLAVHEHLDRRVALKLLHVDRSRDAHHIERFVREALIANKVRHENVVDVTDLQFLPDGRPYVIMEYIEGGTLYTLWDEGGGGLDIVRFLDACIQVSAALAAAHRASIVHRDIKPANIFLTSRGVKIADFGLSKLLAAPGREDHFTASGIVLATPPYMSPEQATGEPIDGRSDLYSLGVTMWEMLVGRRPFRANAFGEYVLMHATRPIEPPSAAGASMVPGGIPAELDAIVLRCLAKKREERYASAEEVRAALVNVRDAITGATPVRPREARIGRMQRAGLALAGAIVLMALAVFAARGRGAEAAKSEPVHPPLRITASALEQPKAQAQPQSMSLPPLVVEPPKAVKMEGLGLKIAPPKPQAPRKHKDAIDPHSLKDPFGGA